jgi:cob(I)alamin adenosyltransferase
MGNRLNKIVTRTGDDGTTGLADGSRCSKSDLRVHCLGEVDELNALVGLCASLNQLALIQQNLLSVQHDLFDLGAELCQPATATITDAHVERISHQAEQLNRDLSPLKEFILPGGSTELAHLHLARTVCRRVERRLVELDDRQAVNPQALVYLNRLSDLLFIMARYHALHSGCDEVYWQSELSRTG